MRKRTFDREEIQEIKTMGYSVEVVTEQLWQYRTWKK
jgi:hypothetical protein